MRRRQAPAVIGLAGKGVELATLALVLSLLPRGLGPHDFGFFATALGAMSLAAALLAVGGPTVMTRFVPAAAPEARRDVAVSLVLRAARARYLAAMAVCSLALVLAAAGALPLIPVVLVVGALLLEVAATLVAQAGLALGAVSSWSFRYPVQNTVLLGATLALHARWGVNGAVAGITVSTLVGLIFVVVTAGPRLAGGRRGAPVPAGLARFAYLQSLAGALLTALQRGAVPAAAVMGATEIEVAQIGIAIGITMGAAYAVAQAFAAELVDLAALDPVEGEKRAVRQALTAVVVLPPVALLAILTAEPLLTVVAGASYAPGAAALAIALAALPLTAAISALNSVAALRHRPIVRVRAGVAGVTVFVVAAAGLVPRHGAVGATTAFFLGLAAVVLAGAVGTGGLAWLRVSAIAQAGAWACFVAAVVWG